MPGGDVEDESAEGRLALRILSEDDLVHTNPTSPHIRNSASEIIRRV
jgi:hypothetical protein